MTRDTADLLKQALTLPVAERAELAGSLIESLDNAKDESVEAAWDKEVARRMEQNDSGKVQPVSLEQARQKLSSAAIRGSPHSENAAVQLARPDLVEGRPAEGASPDHAKRGWHGR